MLWPPKYLYPYDALASGQPDKPNNRTALDWINRDGWRRRRRIDLPPQSIPQ
jgi:hypothetical protein